MTQTYFHYILIIAVEMMAIYAFARQGFHWLNVLLIANMITVSITAKQLLYFPIGTTNAGSLFYAFIVPIQFIILKRFGNTAARRVIKKTLLVLLLVTIFRLLVVSIDSTVAGNEEIKYSYELINQESFLILGASFLAFYLAFIVWLEAIEKIKNNFIAFFVGVVVWQLIDSIVFFPAFFLSSSMDLTKVAEFLIVGFSVKSGIGFLAFFVLFILGFRAKKVE